MRLPRRAALGTILAGTALAVIAFGAPKVFASLSQGYHAAKTYPAGTLVSLDSAHVNTVIIADQNHLDGLLGVTVPDKSASLALSPGNDTVQVVTDGTAYALVSTENGTIQSGDHIAVSTIAGVGMRATSTTRVVGVAQGSFDGTSSSVAKQTVTDGTGAKHEVIVGQIPILVGVSSYAKDAPPSNSIPPVIQRLIDQLIGKPVSPIRIIIAAILLGVTLIGVATLLYGSVQGALISIGRNPLSKKSIFRGLFQVMLVAIAIMGAAVGVIYFILKS